VRRGATATATTTPSATRSIGKRFATLDAVYAQRWADVDNLRVRETDRGVHPRLWDGAPSPRWYRPAELEAAKAAWRTGMERSDAPAVPAAHDADH
jgi:hypothetical protein